MAILHRYPPTFSLSAATMSNRNANDVNGPEGSSARGWRTSGQGLILGFFGLGIAILVAITFSGGPSSLWIADELAVARAKYLQGVRDPSRSRWRTTDTPWNLMGTHEIAPDIEDTGRGAKEEKEERR